MTLYFLELPDWQFDAREESAGVYRLTGRWHGETRIERTGTDTAKLLEECRADALEMEGKK